MKQRIAALAAALCLLLAACGDTTAAGKTPYDGDDVETLLGSDIFSETPEALDQNIACGLLGVDVGLVSECQAYLPTSTNGEALILLVLNDAGDAESVQESCENWIEEQIESYQDYGPDCVPKLEGAVISVRENTVLLVVGSDPAAAQAAVDGLE